MYVQERDRDGGLGFPVGLVVMGVTAAVSAIKARKKRKAAEAASKLSWNEAQAYVRSQFLELLGREPESGTGYEEELTSGRCDKMCVREDILNSAEYAMRARKQLQQTAPPSTSLVSSLLGPVLGTGNGPTTGGGATSPLMQYAPYLLGGVLLLTVLKK